jgi:hypothetical protein
VGIRIFKKLLGWALLRYLALTNYNDAVVINDRLNSMSDGYQRRIRDLISERRLNKLFGLMVNVRGGLVEDKDLVLM